MELFTVYGLYLSDFEVLNPIETELVVFVTISCLGLGTGPALWHLRGLGRLLGARGEDESTPELRKVKEVGGRAPGENNGENTQSPKSS